MTAPWDVFDNVVAEPALTAICSHLVAVEGQRDVITDLVDPRERGADRVLTLPGDDVGGEPAQPRAEPRPPDPLHQRAGPGQHRRHVDVAVVVRFAELEVVDLAAHPL